MKALFQIPLATSRRGRGQTVVRCLAWLAAAGLISGCSTPTYRDVALGDGFSTAELAVKSHNPDNVFLQAAVLPRSIRRVVALPVSVEGQHHDLMDASERFSPVVQSALARTGKFEITTVNPAVLRDRTGRMSWTGNEVLPPRFFETLNEVCGCDAVLFCELTTFRAYPPMVIGWRMKLVDARTRQMLWAVDEVFNAGQPEVLTAVRRYLRDEVRTSLQAQDEWISRNSPQLFAQYTSTRLLSTLPDR